MVGQVCSIQFGAEMGPAVQNGKKEALKIRGGAMRAMVDYIGNIFRPLQSVGSTLVESPSPRDFSPRLVDQVVELRQRELAHLFEP